MIHFREYLENKLTETGKSRAEVYKALGMTRSSMSNYLKGKRTPDHKVIKSFVSYFSTKKTDRRKDLYFIYFGE